MIGVVIIERIGDFVNPALDVLAPSVGQMTVEAFLLPLFLIERGDLFAITRQQVSNPSVDNSRNRLI